MTLQALLLAVLMTLPPWYQDAKKEEPSARAARMEVIAYGIATAVGRATCRVVKDPKCKPVWLRSEEELGLLLVMKGWWESRFALHIHQDKCRVKIGECDAGRAKSPWQLQMSLSLPSKDWSRIGGVDKTSTMLAASAAAVVLVRSYGRCKTLEGAISLYATGKSCKWSKAKDRLLYFRRLQAKARKIKLDAAKEAVAEVALDR